MFFKPLSLLSKKTFHLRQFKRLSHETIVYRGQNLPFNITNARTLAIKMVIFLGSAFGTPFIIVRHHLLKASGGGAGSGGGSGGAPKKDKK